MHILIHCYNYTDNTESIGLNVNRYANGFIKRDHEVTIITRKNSGDVDFEITQNGIKVYRINRGNIPIISSILYMLKVKKLIGKIKPDIVHEHEAFGGAYLTKKCYNIPYVVYGRGIDIYKFNWWWTKKVLKNADYIIALSEHMKNFIDETIQPNTPVDVIRNGVYQDEYKFTNKNRPNRILYVGRLITKKNVDKLIEAMQYVVEDYPDTLLTIAGDGYEMCKLTDLIEDCGLTHNVSLLGKVDRDFLQKLYQHAGIFVMPTEHTEGCNNTILEAMFSGCTVICTPHYGNDELIKNLKNGILLVNVEPEHIANNIRYAIDKFERTKHVNMRNENKKILSDLSKHGFDVESNVKELEMIYNEVITKEVIIK